MDTATVTVSSSGASKTSAAKKTDKAGTSDFMDMIASQLNAQKAAFNKQHASTQPAAGTKTATATATANDLASAINAGDISTLPAELQKLLQNLAAQLQTGANDGKPDTGGSATVATDKTLALLSPAGRQKLLAALQSLVNGLPASARPTVETLENGILKPLDSQNLVADGGKADATPDGTTALVVSGLTPQQLTALMKQIKDGDTTDAASAAGNALASQIALIQLTPVAIKKDAVPAPQNALLTAGKIQAPQKPDAAQAATDAAAAKTIPTELAPDKITPAKTDTAPLSAAMTQVRPDMEGLPQKNSGGFEHILKMFETARQDQSSMQVSANTAPKPDATAGASAVAAAALAATDATAGSLTVAGASLDPAAISAMQVQGLPPTTAAAGLTNLITAAPQAIYPHPAAAQLAASITSEFRSDGNTSLTLRLDPPDLGHVSVKMEFRDDKTVKAVVSADKPETYMMMQRDAHVLQKAFNDAGLNTGSNGLTFELSQDGSAFGQQNRQGNAFKGGKNTGGGDDAMTIETTMDWSVDAGGAWHYNALA